MLATLPSLAGYASALPLLEAARAFLRYAAALPGFLARPLTPQECRERIERQMARREESFLDVVERGIWAKPASPYRKLLDHAGVRPEDISASVRRHGVEHTLGWLYDAGVRVTINEFKGRRPIERGSWKLEVRPGDFDNPLVARHYDGRTGGSGGVRRRLPIDLDLLAYEAALYYFFLQSFGLEGRPLAAWREAPPGSAGLSAVLRYAKLGRPVEKWFSPCRTLRSRRELAPFFLMLYTAGRSRLGRLPLPFPEYSPESRAGAVAQWLAETCRRCGTPAVLDASPSAAVLVCLAAQERHIDISGAFFRIGGEPLTAAKARIFAEAGATVACNYHMSEAGVIGLACRSGAALDEVHLTTDKLAVIQRRKPVGDGSTHVGALVYSTILPYSPKLLLNVESDDYGVLEDRRCGCVFEELGLTRHLHTIRSYEKLTAAGITFLGTELLTLLEEVLPARFGGRPSDYQLVEEETAAGHTRVSVLIRPSVGPLDEQEVTAAVLDGLRRCPGGPLMADVWRGQQVLRVIRREPHASSAGKILPLHFKTPWNPAGPPPAPLQ